MTTVTALTAQRMLEIEANSVVDGAVVGDNLILTKNSGDTIDAGNVRGAKGDAADTIEMLEAVQLTIYGDSYTQYEPASATPGPRVAKRNNMLTPINYGISGTTFKQNFDRILATWVPNTRGLVLIGEGTVNNMQVYPDNATGYATAREAFRACLAYLSDRAVSLVSDWSGCTKFGPGWTTDADGRSGGVGAYVDIAWDSNAGDLYVKLVTGAGGTLQVKNSAGTVLGTIVTGGYAENMIGVLSLPSQGAGAHTVRATVTAGTVIVNRVGARAATPPKIIWDKAAPIPFGGTAVGTTRLKAFQAQEIVAAQAFPNVLIAENDRTGWDKNTMISADTAHRNDKGNDFATDTMQAVLRAAITSYQQGLHAVVFYTADAPYVIPSPAYVGPGAAAPNAPVLTAVPGNQVRLTWTRPVDNGSTITSYRIESSPAGAGTWTLVANPAAGLTSYEVETGLTATNNYDFRIRAVNSAGNSGWSNTDDAVAGAASTFYSRDDFDRADNGMSMGNAIVGGAWAVDNSVFGISGNSAAVVSPSKTVPNAFNHAMVNDGQAQGMVKLKITRQDSVAAGVIMAANAVKPTQGIVLWADRANNRYTMSAIIAENVYGPIANYAIVPQDGDVLELHHNGLNYTPIINGVAQATFVGSVDMAGTRHGIMAWGNTGLYDDYTHTNKSL